MKVNSNEPYDMNKDWENYFRIWLIFKTKLVV